MLLIDWLSCYRMAGPSRIPAQPYPAASAGCTLEEAALDLTMTSCKAATRRRTFLRSLGVSFRQRDSMRTSW